MKARRDGIHDFIPLLVTLLTILQRTKTKAPSKRKTAETVGMNSKSKSGARNATRTYRSVAISFLQLAQTRMKRLAVALGILRCVHVLPTRTISHSLSWLRI
jgi:hypothetical protein